MKIPSNKRSRCWEGIACAKWQKQNDACGLRHLHLIFWRCHIASSCEMVTFFWDEEILSRLCRHNLFFLLHFWFPHPLRCFTLIQISSISIQFTLNPVPLPIFSLVSRSLPGMPLLFVASPTSPPSLSLPFLSWLIREVSPKPPSTALACPGQPHVQPRLGVGHWGIQAARDSSECLNSSCRNFWEQLRNLGSKDILVKWLWNWSLVGLWGENVLNSGSKSPQELKFRPGLLWETHDSDCEDVQECYWSQVQEDVRELQAMGPSWRGQCPHLIIASCGIH